MSDEAAFLAAIAAAPADDAPRLVYADWLDEQGRAEQAEAIRREQQWRVALARFEVLRETLDSNWLDAVFPPKVVVLKSYPEGSRFGIVRLVWSSLGYDVHQAATIARDLPARIPIPTSLVTAEKFRAESMALGADVEIETAVPDTRPRL